MLRSHLEERETVDEDPTQGCERGQRSDEDPTAGG